MKRKAISNAIPLSTLTYVDAPTLRANKELSDVANSGANNLIITTSSTNCMSLNASNGITNCKHMH